MCKLEFIRSVAGSSGDRLIASLGAESKRTIRPSSWTAKVAGELEALFADSGGGLNNKRFHAMTEEFVASQLVNSVSGNDKIREGESSRWR